MATKGKAQHKLSRQHVPVLLLTLLVSSAQAACSKVHRLPHCQLWLVYVSLADICDCACDLEAVKALPVVSDSAAHLVYETGNCRTAAEYATNQPLKQLMASKSCVECINICYHPPGISILLGCKC
jgi:hypothetical protein